MVNTGVMHSIGVLGNSNYNICTGVMHSLEILYNKLLPPGSAQGARASRSTWLRLGPSACWGLHPQIPAMCFFNSNKNSHIEYFKVNSTHNGIKNLKSDQAF